MFSGIISELGTIEEVHLHNDSATLTLSATHTLEGLPPGGSLAVNGVCLTAVHDVNAPGVFTAELMGETLQRTNLGAVRPGDTVNLERCVTAATHLDGHIVQGHIDTTGHVTHRTDHEEWTTLRVSLHPQYAPLVAEKGSIALNGVSLTITAVSDPGESQPWCEVGLIPTTMAQTNLGRASTGTVLNIEVDVLAKYTQRLLAFAPSAHQENAS
ncbi:riboflavin synthase [Jonesia quinghaiensis]|uniref:riboflavin synthase n=1 Tax=Jonesia quinghaiensis TaxID=262806 RepID=UPI0003FDD098|nr:riboflavin synthase [Jonesia quinghaiensis]